MVFDGVCNLCNGWVQFLLKRDASEQFYFAPAQSKTGHQVMSAAGALEFSGELSGESSGGQAETTQVSQDPYQSFVVVTDYLGRDQSEYLRSAAVMALLKKLPWRYRWLSVFGILPERVLDFFYSIVAKNRYRWFGKRTSCMIPSKSERLRFLDAE